jgi:hypothetical protein
MKSFFVAKVTHRHHAGPQRLKRVPVMGSSGALRVPLDKLGVPQGKLRAEVVSFPVSSSCMRSGVRRIEE